jgi:hypothetical protein
MRLLVCGGRDYANRDRVYAALDRVHAKRGVTCVIDGAARGADTLAHNWAVERGIANERYPANWSRDGKAAGPIRNARMLLESSPDAAVAFGGGLGTADMVRRVKAARLPVWEIDR